MQSIEKFVQTYCGDNTLAAAYWLGINENDLIDLLGWSNDSQLPEKLLNRVKQLEKEIEIFKTTNEIRALERVIESLMSSQERLVAEAENIINIYTRRKNNETHT